ncbi:MAG: hypothetical protein KAH18_12550 [Psychromonas sp.]|nr:hypothetical protein [Psychromonas sp.]
MDINGLYNIGPLNKGALSSTNAFWFNLVCAERWAHNWINDFNPINNLKNNGGY